MKTYKNQIRRKLRLQRQELTKQQQDNSSKKLLQKFIKLPEFETSQHIAAYSANDGEINLETLIKYICEQGKSCYLPVLGDNKSKKMHFIRVDTDEQLNPNRYGIAEPIYDSKKEIAPKDLDLVMLPLVAFDNTGNRIGMGGGYYDRTFYF